MDRAIAEYARYRAIQDEWSALLAYGDLLPLSLRLATLAFATRELGFEPGPFLGAISRAHSESDVFVDGVQGYGRWSWYARAYLGGFDRGTWISTVDAQSEENARSQELLRDLEIARSTSRARDGSAASIATATLREAAELALGAELPTTRLSALSRLLSLHRSAALAFARADRAVARTRLMACLALVEDADITPLKSLFVPRLVLMQASLGTADVALAQLAALRREYVDTSASSLLESALVHLQFNENARAGRFLLAVPNYPLHGVSSESLEALEGNEHEAGHSLLADPNEDIGYAIEQLRVRAALCGSASMLRQAGRLRAKSQLQRHEYGDAIVSYVLFSTKDEIGRDLERVLDEDWKALFQVTAPALGDLANIIEFASESRANLSQIIAMLLKRSAVSVETRARLVPRAVAFARSSTFNLIGNFNALTPVVDAIVALLEEAAPVVASTYSEELADGLRALLSSGTYITIQDSILRACAYAMQVRPFATAHGEGILDRVVALLEALDAGAPWPVSATAFVLLSNKNAAAVLANAPTVLVRAQTQAKRHLNRETTLGRQQPDLLLRVYAALNILSEDIQEACVADGLEVARNPSSSESMNVLLKLLRSRDALTKRQLDKIAGGATTLLQWRDHRGNFVFTIATGAFLVYELARPKSLHPGVRALSTLYRAVLLLLRDSMEEPNRLLGPQWSNRLIGISNWAHAALAVANALGSKGERADLEVYLNGIASHDDEAAAAVHRARLDAAKGQRRPTDIPISTGAAFYASLPRFVADDFVNGEESRGLQRLLEGVRTFGPNALDIAVLALAVRQRVGARQADWGDYQWRVDSFSDKAMRDMLRSLVTRLVELGRDPEAAEVETGSQESDRLRTALADPNEWVELDIEAPHTSADPQVASQLADARQRRIRSGERVARVMRKDDFEQAQRVYETAVSASEALALIRAGARWVGPEHYRPSDQA